MIKKIISKIEDWIWKSGQVGEIENKDSRLNDIEKKFDIAIYSSPNSIEDQSSELKENICKMYRSMWQSMQATYLTLMTQSPESNDYLISETLIWNYRHILNKMYDLFENILLNNVPFAKKLEQDCICHTREEHIKGIKELGTLNDVDKIYGTV